MMERGQTYIGVRQVLWVGLCMLLLCGCSRGTYVGELPEDDDGTFDGEYSYRFRFWCIELDI